MGKDIEVKNDSNSNDAKRELLVYLVVGVMTTVFCWVLIWIMERILTAEVISANAFLNFMVQTVDWLAGVLFAYPLNRKWVFRSTNPHIMKELIGFGGSRVSTWALDALIMMFFVNVVRLDGFIKWCLELFRQEVLADGSVHIDFLFIKMNTTLVQLNFWFAKIFISSVLVMIVNYIFSKLLIFKKEKPEEVSESK